MKSISKTILTTAITGLLMTGSAFASETPEEFHDADPRNTNWRGGIGVSEHGEIKLGAGGGGANLFYDDYQTQTNVLFEYYTDSENMRFRSAHFDERFGGAYVDLNYLDDTAGFYTAGYMLPLETAEGTMFFPSVNYSYVDIDTDGISNTFNEGCSAPNADIIPICGTDLSSSAVRSMLGNEDEAHMGTLNLYVLQPWNDTHYTVLNANMGSSFDGVDMNVTNLMWLQGVKTKLGDNVLNIYLELKYDVIELEGANYNPMLDNTFKSEETTATFGFDFRF